MALRASLTSSSLKGLMIASTFFIISPFLILARGAGMRWEPRRSRETRRPNRPGDQAPAPLPSARPRPYPSPLSVNRQIKTHHLLLFRDTKAHEGPQGQQDQNRDTEGVDPRNASGQELHQELLGIAVKEAIGTPRDRRGGEQTCGDGTPSATDAMDAEDIEGVVVSACRFEFHHPEVATDPGADPYEDGGDRPYVAGGRGDGHEPGNGTSDRPQGRRFAPVRPLDEEPHHGGRCGGRVGHNEGAGREST